MFHSLQTWNKYENNCKMPDFMRLHTQNGDSPSPFLPIWQINDTLEEEDCYRFLAQRWCTSSFWSKSIWQIFNGVVLTPDGIDDLLLLRETGVLLLCLLFASISELKVDEALSFQSHMVILSNAHLSSTLLCLEKNPIKVQDWNPLCEVMFTRWEKYWQTKTVEVFEKMLNGL